MKAQAIQRNAEEAAPIKEEQENDGDADESAAKKKRKKTDPGEMQIFQ